MPTQGTTTNATAAKGWVSSSGVNDGSSVFNAGNVASDSPVSNPVTIISTVDDLRDVGSKIVANDGTGAATTDRVGIAKALSGGTLAYQSTSSQWVMRGGGVTSTLSNVASTSLATPGADYNGVVRDGTHELLTTRLLGTQVFDLLARPSTNITPNFTKSGADGDLARYIAPSGAGTDGAGLYDSALADGSVDNAATTTRSIPGELTYHFGGLAAPTTDEYKAKDEYES